MTHQHTQQDPAVSSRVVLVAVFGFLAFVALTMGGLHLYYRWLIPGTLKTAVRTFPAPRLQSSPQSDLGLFKAAQHDTLQGYAWVDQAHGVVRIPIEDAMGRVAARGVRGYDAPDQPEAVPSPAKDAVVQR